MPPFYDLECGNCNYERDDVYFKSQKAFEKSAKECPQCGETLNKKLSKFNIHTGKRKAGKVKLSMPKALSLLEIGLGEAPSGEKFIYLNKYIAVPLKKQKSQGLPKINLN